MTEFIAYTGLTALQLNGKLILLLRNVRQTLCETSLYIESEDSDDVRAIKEELVAILRGFTSFFKEFHFDIHNSPELINLLIANAKKIEFTEDEAADKDRVFGVFMVFVHFHDGLTRLKKSGGDKNVSKSDDLFSVYGSTTVLVITVGIAVTCFLMGGMTHASRPSLFEGILGSFIRKK